MDTKTALELAGKVLQSQIGTTFDVLTLARPADSIIAVALAKIVSKLSPMIGNLIELSAVDLLNRDPFTKFGKWVRQDPDFPDAIFVGSISPAPGLEIKTWFPLATEITARFKDSQIALSDNNTNVALLAWLPEHLIYGRPKLIDATIFSGKSVAEARDKHYHDPPNYLVIEPEDTSSRTRNLRQSNTAGFVFQGTSADRKRAAAVVSSWGVHGTSYSPSPNYQAKLRSLMGSVPYRNDTNFAKMDRIEHGGTEAFKQRVLESTFLGRPIRHWANILHSADGKLLEEHLPVETNSNLQ